MPPSDLPVQKDVPQTADPQAFLIKARESLAIKQHLFLGEHNLDIDQNIRGVRAILACLEPGNLESMQGVNAKKLFKEILLPQLKGF
jgi:hypothetical protein